MYKIVRTANHGTSLCSHHELYIVSLLNIMRNKLNKNQEVGSRYGGRNPIWKSESNTKVGSAWMEIENTWRGWKRLYGNREYLTRLEVPVWKSRISNEIGSACMGIENT